MMDNSALAISDSVDSVQFYDSELVDDFDDDSKFNESLSAQYDTIVMDTPGGSVSWNLHVEPIVERTSRTYFMDSIKTHVNSVVSLLSTVVSISDDRKSYAINPNAMFIDQPCSFIFDGIEFSVSLTREGRILVTRITESDVGYRDYPERVTGNQLRFAIRVVKKLIYK